MWATTLNRVRSEPDLCRLEFRKSGCDNHSMWVSVLNRVGNKPALCGLKTRKSGYDSHSILGW